MVSSVKSNLSLTACLLTCEGGKFHIKVLISALHYRCEYLLQEKGQDFVHQIQARFPRLFEQVSRKPDSKQKKLFCVEMN